MTPFQLGRVFLGHRATLGGLFVAAHGANLVHGAVDGVGIVTVLSTELVFKKFWQGTVSTIARSRREQRHSIIAIAMELV